MKYAKHLFLYCICLIAWVGVVRAQSDCSSGDGVLTMFLSNDHIPKCPTGELMLVFEDHFDDNGLDHTRWYERERVIRDFNFTHSKQFYKKENIIVEDGKLKIVVKRENLTNQFFGDNAEFTSDFEFTSGEVNTLFEFGYGVYEAKIKLPKGGGKGFFPAFWGFSDAAGTWNEIDVFEAKSSSQKQTQDVDGTTLYKLNELIHSSFGKNDQTGAVYRCTSKSINDDDLGGDFHIYKVVYRPYYIEWFVDNKSVRKTYHWKTELGQNLTCGSLRRNNKYIRDQSMPTKPMNIKIDLAIESGSKKPAPHDLMPNTMEVEHVKIWQFVPCNGDIVINSQSELDAILSSQTNYYNAVYGSNITIDNAVLKNNQSLILISDGDITLGPDFVTETGSFLEMQHVQSGPCSSGTAIVEDVLSSATNMPSETWDDGSKQLTKDFLTLKPNAEDEGGGWTLTSFSDSENEYSVIITNSLGQEVFSDCLMLASPYHIRSAIFQNRGMYVVKIESKNSSEIHYEKVMIY